MKDRILRFLAGGGMAATGLLTLWFVVPPLWRQGSSTALEWAVLFVILAIVVFGLGLVVMWESIKQKGGSDGN